MRGREQIWTPPKDCTVRLEMAAEVHPSPACNNLNGVVTMTAVPETSCALGGTSQPRASVADGTPQRLLGAPGSQRGLLPRVSVTAWPSCGPIAGSQSRDQWAPRISEPLPTTTSREQQATNVRAEGRGHLLSPLLRAICAVLSQDREVYESLHQNGCIPLAWELAGHLTAAIMVGIYGFGTRFRRDASIPLGIYLAGHLLLTLGGGPFSSHQSVSPACSGSYHLGCCLIIGSFCYLDVRFALATDQAAPFGDIFFYTLSSAIPVCARSLVLVSL